VPKSTTDFKIASQQQKKVNLAVDLMSSGSGIPWEDRGSRGVLGAFFATIFAMMFSPAKTLAQMRRPETNTDAKLFSYAIGGIWFLAYIIQSTFAYYVFYNNDPKLVIDGQQYVINTGLGAVASAVAAVFLSTFVSQIFFRLTAFDATTKTPPVLSFNCLVYALSPSILALIPGGPKPWFAIAPCVAGLWIFVELIIVSISRLHIRVGAAIIGSILTFLATAGMVAGGIVAVNLLWNTLLDKGSITPFIPTGGSTMTR
jgi:hypothetical protein